MLLIVLIVFANLSSLKMIFISLYNSCNTKCNFNISKGIYIAILFFTIIFSHNHTFAKINANDIAVIENHLNKIKTIKVAFKQIGPEKNIQRQGICYIAKPGKIKWQYLTPKKITIISNQNKVSYYDYEMEELTKITQDHTLAKLLTTPSIDLKNTVNIISIINHKNYIELIASKKEKLNNADQYPYVILNFKKKPEFKIDKVTIINDEITFTDIEFSQLEINKSLDDSIFQFKDPKFFELRDN